MRVPRGTPVDYVRYLLSHRGHVSVAEDRLERSDASPLSDARQRRRLLALRKVMRALERGRPGLAAATAKTGLYAADDAVRARLCVRHRYASATRRGAADLERMERPEAHGDGEAIYVADAAADFSERGVYTSDGHVRDGASRVHELTVELLDSGSVFRIEEVPGAAAEPRYELVSWRAGAGTARCRAPLALNARLAHEMLGLEPAGSDRLRDHYVHVPAAQLPRRTAQRLSDGVALPSVALEAFGRFLDASLGLSDALAAGVYLSAPGALAASQRRAALVDDDGLVVAGRRTVFCGGTVSLGVAGAGAACSHYTTFRLHVSPAVARCACCALEPAAGRQQQQQPAPETAQGVVVEVRVCGAALFGSKDSADACRAECAGDECACLMRRRPASPAQPRCAARLRVVVRCKHADSDVIVRLSDNMTAAQQHALWAVTEATANLAADTRGAAADVELRALDLFDTKLERMCAAHGIPDVSVLPTHSAVARLMLTRAYTHCFRCGQSGAIVARKPNEGCGDAYTTVKLPASHGALAARWVAVEPHRAQ